MSKIAMILPGGVDPSGTHRVIPALLWLIRRLAAHHDLHVFVFHQQEGPPRYELLGATVHDLGAGRSRIFSLARSLRILYGEHERGPFALLHAVWAVPPGVIAAIAGKLLRRPVLLHLAGGELVALEDVRYGGRRTLRGRIQVWAALRGAARITTASIPLQAAAARLGFPAQRMPLGVDLEEWPPVAPRPRDPGSAARLLHVASLNRVKDQSTLLRAAARLAAEGVSFQLDIVGTDTLAGQMQRAADALGLSDRVRFHGFLTQQELRPLLERADLLLVSSRHEAGPVVLLEAAVAGVPTVGTAVGQIAEWAPDAAIAVPVGDHRALAAETAALLADDSRRLRIAAAAQARALESDADWTAGQVLRDYAELMAPE